MPYVLEGFGSAVEGRLTEPADHLGMGAGGRNTFEKARLFIEYILERNQKMDIPKHIANILESDIPKMTSRALAEGNPL